MPRRLWICTVALLLPLLPAPARADLEISFNSQPIPQGSTGTLDVFLTSTASPSSPDLFNNYEFTLQITGPNELQFATLQSYAYLTSSQYVFAGDSLDQTNLGFGGTVSTTVYGDDAFVGYDSTLSGNSVSLSSTSSPVLLAALTLDASITNPRDSYTISLVPAGGNGSSSSSLQTYFDVVNWSTVAETSAVPFTSSSGTVTISTTLATPEPSSMVVSLGVVLIMAGVHGVRRLRR